LDIILGTQIVKSYVIVGVEGKFFLEKNNILLAQKEFSQFITTDSHSTPQNFVCQYSREESPHKQNRIHVMCHILGRIFTQDLPQPKSQ
jgi:hypothetical protein